MAEEKVLSANGNAAASPWTTLAFEPLLRAPSFAANPRSYSRLVTRAARHSNSSVAAPDPAPNASTCSPSSEPCKIHGKSCRRVTHRQRRVPQNHVSYRFMESSGILDGAQLCRKRAVLMKHCTNLAERRSELIGAVGRRILELLEEAVDGGADFRGVGWLGVFAVRDVQRVHCHGGLFRGALVRQRNILGVIRDALQHPQREDLIVLHCRQLRRNSLRRR